jgi:gas vesicle protein
MNEHPGRNFLLGAVIGSSLGALTALMFTTEKGQKIKKELIKKYPEIQHMMQSFAHHPHRTIKAAAKKVKRRVASKAKRTR